MSHLDALPHLDDVLQPGGVYFIEDLASGRYLVDGDKQHIIQVRWMGPARARQLLTLTVAHPDSCSPRQLLTRHNIPALQRAAAVC